MGFTEEIENIITGIMAGGITATTVISVINLIKGTFSGIKVNKLMNFTAVADKNIKDNQMGFGELKKQLLSNFTEIVNQVKTEIVVPLKQELLELKNDNVMLADLTVSLLSLVNVPLDQKRQFFNSLCKITTISAEATKLLSASIESQEKQQITAKATDTVIEQKITNS
jgi:hypothetical protein